MTTAARSSYAGHRFPAEVISHAVWLYFRFPLSLRMVDELLAARGITVSHETVRQWTLKFGQAFANQACSQQLCHQPPFRTGVEQVAETAPFTNLWNCPK